MFSHVTVGTNDVARSKSFYDGLAKPLGLVRHAEYPNALGYGRTGGRPQLWIVSPLDKKAASVGNGITIGLEAPDRPAVDAAYKAGMAAAARTRVRPGCERTIIPTIMAPISGIPTATRSASSATSPRRRRR